MALSFRQSEILGIARVEGRVEVEELARRFGVTLQTIRRDLTELADTGKLDRVHGGAMLRANNLGFAAERDFVPDPRAVALIGDSYLSGDMWCFCRWIM